MANLTADQYQGEMDKAFTQVDANSATNIDRGAGWAQIAGTYCHLWVHQEVFDIKGITPSAKALGYRTKAENYLKAAKAKIAQLPLSSAGSCVASNAASVAAYAYVQQVRVENALEGSG